MTTHPVKLLGVRHAVAIPGSREARIAMIATAQRGRVARRQLHAAGVPSRTVDNLAAKGYLHREHRGVFLVGHRVEVAWGRETSALLACGDGAVLSHLSAAKLWNFLVRQDRLIHITIAGRHGPNPTGVKTHRTSHFHPKDLRIRQRLPVTSPARTLLDIAEMVSERELERALDEALRQSVSVNQIQELLARSPGRRGMSILMAALERRTGSTQTRSGIEERFLALMRSAELPEPELNVPLCGFTVDVLWRKQRVVVELDTYDFHVTRFSFNRDRRKDAILKAANWDPNRVSEDQLDHEPLAVVARLARVLALAERASPQSRPDGNERRLSPVLTETSVASVPS